MWESISVMQTNHCLEYVSWCFRWPQQSEKEGGNLVQGDTFTTRPQRPWSKIATASQKWSHRNVTETQHQFTRKSDAFIKLLCSEKQIIVPSMITHRHSVSDIRDPGLVCPDCLPHRADLSVTDNPQPHPTPTPGTNDRVVGRVHWMRGEDGGMFVFESSTWNPWYSVLGFVLERGKPATSSLQVARPQENLCFVFLLFSSWCICSVFHHHGLIGVSS